MDRHDVDWHGYVPAVTTPFDRDGALDLDALGEQLEWLVGQGMHGVVLAGTTGEWFSLTEDERGRWQEYRRRRLLGEGLGEQNLPAYFAQIDELRTTHADDAGKLALLDALAAWGRQLESTL